MLTKGTEYAIRALIYIALQNRKERKPSIKEIATQTGSPEHFIAKILQRLTRNHLINANKGPGGGFYFDRKAPLPLYSVIKIIEGEHVFEKCGLGLKSCNEKEPCPLHNHFKPIRESFYRLATNESIQSLANKITDEHAVLFRTDDIHEDNTNQNI